MDDMHSQHETPTSDAARGVGHYVTGALAAADLSVRMLTWFRQRTDPQAPPLQPGDLDQAGRVLDPRRDAYDAMLERDAGRQADSRTALPAWVSAQPHRDGDPQAELVAGRAEIRLRDLHPDAMTRYDQLRTGLSPVEAMREVVPLIVAEQQQASAREVFSSLLDPVVATNADSGEALAAWSAALPLTDTLPDAATAAVAAATRLRELHPQAMSRYDALLDSHTPAAALDEVASLIDPTLAAAPGRPSDVDAAIDQAGWRATQAPEERYTPVVREVLQDDLADKVLHDDSWPALASAIAKAERLGARPVDLLASAAGQRELGSAKNIAAVLTFRIEQHQVPTQAPNRQDAPPRTPTAADLVTASYPTPLAASGHLARPQQQDLAVLGAALELGREEVAAGVLTTKIDDTSSAAGQRRAGQGNASDRAAAAPEDGGGAAVLPSRRDAVRVGAPAAATAAYGYPTSMDEVTAKQVAPHASRQGVAPRAAASRKAPVSARRL